MITEKFFIIISIILFVLLLTGKLYFYNHKNRFIKEKSVAISTIALVFYILSALINVFTADVFAKPIMFLCAVSPFIIGHFATYKKLTFYTVLQLIIILIGIFFIY